MLLPQQAMAEDYMCNSNKFYMSSASDHLTFSILMADLYGRDTWLSSGHVKAYSNSNGTGTCYELVDVSTADQSNTDSHRIFGVVLPRFLIIFIISLFLRRFEQLEVIKYAFFGIRAGVLALLVKAVVSMFRKCPKNIVAYLIMAASFAAVAFFSANVLIVIVSAAVIGIAATLIARKAGKKL